MANLNENFKCLNLSPQSVQWHVAMTCICRSHFDQLRHRFDVIADMTLKRCHVVAQFNVFLCLCVQALRALFYSYVIIVRNTFICMLLLIKWKPCRVYFEIVSRSYNCVTQVRCGVSLLFITSDCLQSTQRCQGNKTRRYI